MMLSHWLLRRWPRQSRPAAPLQSSRRRSVKLSVEQLENRLTPAVIFDVDRLDDPSAWDIIGDDSNAKTFFGTPFIAYYTDGIPTFEIIDDVSVPDGTEIQAATPGLPIIIVVSGNLTLGQNVFINFAASGATPGPGGGAGGTAGAGGAGGQGGPGGAGGAGGTGREAGIGEPLATNGAFGGVPDPASGLAGSRGGEGGAGGNGFNEGFAGRGGNSLPSNPGTTAADAGGTAGLVFAGNGGDALYRTTQNGGAGGAGTPGWIGFNIPSNPDLLSGGGGGGGGAGGAGGAGGSGGAGGGGGAGANLGHHLISPLIFVEVDGGNGGAGGDGGRGGNGAAGIEGGAGGGGGGAFKFLVTGTLVVGAGSVFSVQGGDGVVRDPLVVRPGEKLDPFNVTDMYGQPGSPGTAGPGSEPSFGGDGGAGARGGDGGNGGGGGSGAGGAGGTIWLEAAAIEFGASVTLNIRGGSGGNIFDSDGWLGGEGRLIVRGTSVTGTATVVHNGPDFTLDEVLPPTITSASSDTFTAGISDSFTIKTTGLPFPGITLEAGTLPPGIVFQDNGDGTAFLAGTPTSGGKFELTFKAANDSGSVTQVFTLTVKQAPAFTSVNSSTFEIGVFGSFDITTVGFPDPAISKLGTLPNGITFTNHGDGTATLAGTPTENGSFNLGFVASNGVEPTASQGFTLTVTQPPAITSDDSTTFVVGSAGSFLVTTTGFPLAALSQSGTLPAGVSFTDKGNGTATLAGTPTENGVFSISIGAANGVAPGATQTFTLTVNQSPAFTSGTSGAFTVGSPGSFSITTSGFPEVTSIVLSDGSLPAGITLTYHDDGTATLGGTPAAGSGGVYQLEFTASNGVTPAAVQSFTLTINQPPAITSGHAAAFTVGAAGSFSIATTGFPVATAITMTGLPAGLTLTNHGNGTATLSGTPAPGTSGVYHLQLVANNGIDPEAVQSFTLTVNAGNISNQVRLSWPASFKNLGNQRFQVVFTLTNLGKQAISGPIQLAWPGLPPGVTVVNSSSVASLAAGQSAKVTVVFQNQSAGLLFSPRLYFNRATASLMNLFGNLNSPFKPLVVIG